MSSEEPICSNKAEVKLQNEKSKISFGDGCVIHPKAKIIVEGECSLIFGKYNIIEENVVIKAIPRFSTILNSNEQITIYVGNYNHFKVGCYLENTTVENYNVFDYRCHLENCQVESRNIITPAVVLSKLPNSLKNVIVVNNQLCRNNYDFSEEEFTKTIKEIYKLLADILGPTKKK